MKKLYEKSEITFAIVWIVIYCIVIGNLRGTFGDASPWPLLGLAVLTAVIALFIAKNGLAKKYGLSAWPSDQKRYLWFIPMWILTTGNLWGGFGIAYPGLGQLWAVLSMLLIGYVEETVTDANRLLRSGSLRPVADFDNLDMVLVITTLKGTGETP